MILKQLNNNFIPASGYYSSREWYLSIAGVIEKILRIRDGKRELQNFVLQAPFTQPDQQYIDDMSQAVKDNIDMLFIVNDESYARIYRALTEEYNPIWNVDGTETLTYTRNNTGTQGNVVDHTGTQDVDTTHSGALTTTEGITHTVTTKKTSYNSATLNVTDEVTDTPSAGSTAETDTRKFEVDRTDNLKDEATRTDNLHEAYSETKVRGGNIGVTKSQELIDSEIQLRLNYKFLEIVEHDILHMIAYSC